MSELDPAAAERLVTHLAEPPRLGAGEPVEIVETHISWVLLTGDHAFKIKKPVDLGFADFSTLERRRALCEEEIRLNRRLAESIYLGVVPVGGSVDAPELFAEPAIEYAVKMRRFDADARLDRRIEAGQLGRAQVDDLAERIARFHAGLPADRDDQRHGGAEAVIAAATENVADLVELAGSDTERIAPLDDWTRRECERLEPRFAERKADGAVREGHGDLHTENLVWLDGRIVPFDALEFNPELRWIDVVNETAFLVMDLSVRGHPELAFEFLNRYLEVTGDYDGLAVLRFYLVYRALVRAKVAAIARKQDGETPLADPMPNLDYALAAIEPRRPRLIVTHGLSGSGKTTVTQELLGRLPAVRVRSDLERKRLHGLGEQEASGSGVDAQMYSAAATRATYDTLARVASTALEAGLNVIVDATFLKRDERDRFARIAAAGEAAFMILDCTAPDAELRRRVEQRAAAGGDASEATTAVLERQLASREPLAHAELEARIEVDTTAPCDFEALAARIGAQ